MTECEDVDTQKDLFEIDLDFMKIKWVSDVGETLREVLDESIVDEFLFERGFQSSKKHINDLIAVYQELASEYDITLPTIAESAGESLN